MFMKIALINTAYYPNLIGGTEVSVQILAEGLAKDNEVYVICVGEKDCYEFINNVHVYRVSSTLGCKIDRIQKELYNFKLLNKVEKILKKIKPDIINTNNIYTFSPMIWKMIRKCNIPVVHTIRDYYLFGSSFAIKNAYFRHCTNHISSVTAASNYTLEEHLKKRYFNNACAKKVIPNAINFDIERFKKIKENRINNHSSFIRFGFVGRLETDKGILFLLEVFNQFQKSDIELKIYGKGSFEKDILNYTHENANIHYMGFCDQESLMKKLEEIDVLIVPTPSTFQEPFGRVVLDAYINCIPVIASAVGGLKDIVINGETGILYEADNYEALSKAIIQMQNRDVIKHYFTKIEQNLEKYSVDNQIKMFKILYKETISKSLS